MRTLQYNTITAQITRERVAPISLWSGSLRTWSLFTRLAEGVFGLYLYLYLYFYSNERW